MMDELKKLIKRYEGKRLEFSVMQYFDVNRVLLKILFDDYAQFTAEIRPAEFIHRINKPIELLYHKLFDKSRIRGNISLKEILHDALPGEDSLRDFFKPHPNSAHKDRYPLGLNGGYVVLNGLPNGFLMDVEDLSEKRNMSGTYSIAYTSQQKFDSKGRVCKVLKMYKIIKDNK